MLVPLFAHAGPETIEAKLANLNHKNEFLEQKINQLERKIEKASTMTGSAGKKTTPSSQDPKRPETKTTAYPIYVHGIDKEPESIDLNPAALIANGHVVTFISGMPVVTAPYLGSRPAFDGSDYIVNISSINRDIRLMQQRRRFYQSFHDLDYPNPNLPVLTISGKAEPIAYFGQNYASALTHDINLGSNEIDFAAFVNETVAAYIGIAYDDLKPSYSSTRGTNGRFTLNTGFINIGNLAKSPFYLTAGQIYVPFGRFSSSFISSSLPARLARIKTRPIILGYKSQEDQGPFAAIYTFKADTLANSSNVAGFNLGYVFASHPFSGEMGISLISSIDDAAGFQYNGTTAANQFAGFSSTTNGNEAVKKIPGIDLHWITRFNRYNLTAEWVSSIGRFRKEDLSFNDQGAQPQAIQIEGAATFIAFSKPASLAAGYQWTKDSLALNLPQHRWSTTFNISFWKDTVESLEYRHDIDFKSSQFANGAIGSSGYNNRTYGSNSSADTLVAQIGVYF